MVEVSRRTILTGLALQGLSAVVSRGRAERIVSESAAPPSSAPAPAEQAALNDSLLSYFSESIPKLLRPEQGVLRYPSISPSLPGKQYSTQLWDWDTYWTALGLFSLVGITQDRALHGNIGIHAQGSLLNFLDHQAEDGRIPILIDVNDPDPLGCLKKQTPQIHNQAKPVMGQLALLISDEIGDASWLGNHFDGLLKFHESWAAGNQSAMGLLVWGDDVAIGNDNDPTTFGRPFFSSANLLLNCLYYQDLKAASELAQRLKRPNDAASLSARAKQQGSLIEQYCWDPRDHFYYTADVQCVDRRAELIPNVARGMAMSWKALPLRIQVFTGFLPLWCGLPTHERAAELVETHYNADQKFRADWGVRSLAQNESMYSLDFSSNPSNWLGPIWIIVNYLVWKGLKNYGFVREANELAHKTHEMLVNDLRTSGSLNEYYHPDSGKPLSHKGFLDWNLLVVEMMRQND